MTALWYVVKVEVMRKCLLSSQAFHPRSLWAPPGYDLITSTQVYRIQRLKHLLKILLKDNKKGGNAIQVSWFPLCPRSLIPALTFCFWNQVLPMNCFFVYGTMLNVISRNPSKHTHTRQSECLLIRFVLTHINDWWQRVMESPPWPSFFLHWCAFGNWCEYMLLS